MMYIIKEYSCVCIVIYTGEGMYLSVYSNNEGLSGIVADSVSIMNEQPINIFSLHNTIQQIHNQDARSHLLG